MSRFPKFFLGFVLCSPVILIACGSDSSSSGAQLTDEQFCAKVADMDDLENFDATAIAAMNELIDSAPNDEMRDALKVLVPVLTEMESVDENDPEAMSKVMEIIMDPKVTEAGEVIEKYSTEVCGITDESTVGTGSITMGSTGNIFDDVDLDEIQNYVLSEASQYFVGGEIGSNGMEASDGYTTYTMDFVYAVELGAVAICETIAEGLSMATTDPSVVIIVQDNGTDVAIREIDSDCVEL